MPLLAFVLAAASATSAHAACGAPTPRDGEGPFYKAGAPLRASLAEPGTSGERVSLSGRVLSRDCRPIPGALLDFWQTDERGEYDNTGYRYRGKVLSDANGDYRLETVLPGLYPGRPRHLHVKVSAPGGPVLTTQIYFDARSAPARLVATPARREGLLQAKFDVVLQ